MVVLKKRLSMKTFLSKFILLSTFTLLLSSCDTLYRIRYKQTESSASLRSSNTINSTDSSLSHSVISSTNKTDNTPKAEVSKYVSAGSALSVTHKKRSSGNAFIYNSSYKAEFKKLHPFLASGHYTTLCQEKIISKGQLAFSLPALLAGLSIGIMTIVLIKKSSGNC